MEVTPYTPPVPTAQATSSSSPSVTPTSGEDETQIESDEPNMDGNDFLQIMAAQLANQNIMDPIDTSQYITQMAIMANTVQMMYISEQATVQFATSMIGQEVTIAGYNSEAEYQEWTGTVDSVVFQGGETWIEMDGFLYSPDDVVQISTPATPSPDQGLPEEPTDETEDGTEEPPTDGTEEPPA